MQGASRSDRVGEVLLERIVSEPSRDPAGLKSLGTLGLAADYHVVTNDGFQQFTLCSFQRFRRKLRNARMNLAMAIRTNQYAVFDLCHYSFP